MGTVRRAALAALAAAALALALAATAAAAPGAGPIATFHYTGGPQTFTVPAGVTYLTFDVIGGRGGYPNEGGAPGPGGETIAGLDVTPGQQLTIWVGENAGGSGGWGFTCGGDHGIATEHEPGDAYDGGGGGGSSAVTAGAWTQGSGSCSSSTRPSGEPLIVGGGGGGGGGDEHIPLTRFAGGAGGAGGNPALPGFQGQGDEPSPGGCVGCGAGNNGARGASQSDNFSDTLGGGGGGGGGYATAGNGGGGGGRLVSGNGAQFGGAGGAGGTSFASSQTSNAVYLAGPLSGSGVVTVSAVRQEGFECNGQSDPRHPAFPAGVQYAHVTVEGAAGGTRTGGSHGPPGKGGHGGIVSADLAGFAWDKLNVVVGCAGSDHGGGAGAGFGSGGSKGTAEADEADDGSGGGGGSGVEIGEFPVVVAGGGGGGGGGAETLGETVGGGNGGNGGPAGQSGTWGHDGEREVGGDGGCPGSEFRHHLDGAKGGGSSTGSGGGGGGGGGGGWGGACGGEGGNWPNGGGGGGGGGGSYALPHSAAVTDAKFSTSGGVGTNGRILFSYVVSEPSHVSPAGGSGQQAPIGATFAKPLVAKVVDQEGRPMQGVALTFYVPGNPFLASATFAGGNTWADATTDIHGLATSPELTATLTTGSWQAEAKVSGLPAAEFGLTNTVRPTATALKASANPVLVGEPVTFTATVRGTSGGPTPTGAVQFKSGGSDLGAPVPLSGATAQKSAELPLGSHPIEAIYEPFDGFQTSHAKLTEKVEKATSATAVTSSINPSGFGEAVAFTAHVSHPGGQPTGGTVQFEVDGAAFGAPVAVSGGSATSGSTTALTVAAHEVVARYSGDESIAPSEGRLTQAVGPDATATELTSSVNPSVYGQTVTYTATVKAHGADTPTGSIVFRVDGTQACATTLAGGSASCEPAAALAPGGHEVRAEYAGDADFDPSHGTLTETVAKARTATAVSADVEAPRFGQPVRFSAAVSTLAPGAGAPTGVVQFFLGDQPLGAPESISGGTATTPPIAALPVGVDAVSAVYLGDADHAGSEETLFAEVAPGETTTTLASSANPTHFGVPVAFTATVAPRAPAAGEPEGTVRFSLDGRAICDVPLDAAGQARCPAPTLYAGDHDVTAAYSGEADFEPSDGTLSESVVRVPSYTVASTSASTVEAGQAVTLSAAVGGLPGEIPAGTVAFSSGSRLLGTAPVRQAGPGTGRAELETSALPAGSHEIVARYNGDDAIEPSSSLPILQTVEGKEAKPQSQPGPAAACAARKVRARVLVFRGRNAIRLVARNRAEAPAAVRVRFTDERGRRATKLLGTVRHRFAGKGMFRVVRKLPPAEMKRLRRAGGGISAAVSVAAAPGYCGEESSHPLSVRRLVSGQRVWFEDGSAGHELPRNSPGSRHSRSHRR